MSTPSEENSTMNSEMNHTNDFVNTTGNGQYVNTDLYADANPYVQMKSYQQDIENLKKENSNLKQLKQAASDTFKKLQDEQQRHQKDIEDLSQKLHTETTKVTSLENERNNLVLRIQELESYENTINDIKSGKYILRNEVDELKNNIVSGLQLVDGMVNHNQLTYDNDREKLLSLLQQNVIKSDYWKSSFINFYETINGELLNIKNQFAHYETELKNKEETIKQFDKIKNEHGVEIENHQHQINTLNNRLQSVYNDRDRLQKELKAKDTQVSKLKQRLNNQETQITKHKQDVDKIKHDCEIRINAIELEKEKLNDTIAELQKQLQIHKSNLENEKLTKKNLEAENEKFLNKKKSEIEKELKKEQDVVLSLKKEMLDLEKEKNFYKQKHESEEKQKQEAKTIAQKYQKEVEEAKKLKDEFSKKLIEKEDSRKEAQSKANDLFKQVNEFRERLANFENENKQLHAALKKKAEQEKYYKDREKTIEEKEKHLQIREQTLKNQKQEQSRYIVSQQSYETKKHKKHPDLWKKRIMENLSVKVIIGITVVLLLLLMYLASGPRI